MVNSKKMSRTTVAMIALSILLVLSLILTATGAWFTDSASGDANVSIDMGKVDIGATGTATASLASVTTGVTLANKMVDGDTVTVTLTMTNSSDVKIYAAVTALSVKVYDCSAGVKGSNELAAYEGYFTYYKDAQHPSEALSTIIPDSTATALEKNATMPTKTYTLTFNSNGAANTRIASTEAEIYVEVTATIEAIQFAHVTDAADAYAKLTA